MQYVTPKGCRLSRMNNNIFETETKFQLTLTLTDFDTSGDPLCCHYFLSFECPVGDCITCLFRDMIRACALPAV